MVTINLMPLPGQVHGMPLAGRAVAAHDTEVGPVMAVESTHDADRVTTVSAGSPTPDGGRCIGIVSIYGMPAAVYAHP